MINGGQKKVSILKRTSKREVLVAEDGLLLGTKHTVGTTSPTSSRSADALEDDWNFGLIPFRSNAYCLQLCVDNWSKYVAKGDGPHQFEILFGTGQPRVTRCCRNKITVFDHWLAKWKSLVHPVSGAVLTYAQQGQSLCLFILLLLAVLVHLAHSRARIRLDEITEQYSPVTGSLQTRKILKERA